MPNRSRASVKERLKIPVNLTLPALSQLAQAPQIFWHFRVTIPWIFGIVESLLSYSLLSWACMKVDAKYEHFLLTEPPFSTDSVGCITVLWTKNCCHRKFYIWIGHRSERLAMESLQCEYQLSHWHQKQVTVTLPLCLLSKHNKNENSGFIGAKW